MSEVDKNEELKENRDGFFDVKSASIRRLASAKEQLQI